MSACPMDLTDSRASEGIRSSGIVILYFLCHRRFNHLHVLFDHLLQKKKKFWHCGNHTIPIRNQRQPERILGKFLGSLLQAFGKSSNRKFFFMPVELESIEQCISIVARNRILCDSNKTYPQA